MAEARERLAAARAALAGGFTSTAISAAYYAMLFAARAALSEEDAYAKTHKGTWNLFRISLVEPGRLDRSLFAAIRPIERLRLAADYDAKSVTASDAQAVVATADRFVAAVEEMFD